MTGAFCVRLSWMGNEEEDPSRPTLALIGFDHLLHPPDHHPQDRIRTLPLRDAEIGVGGVGGAEEPVVGIGDEAFDGVEGGGVAGDAEGGEIGDDDLAVGAGDAVVFEDNEVADVQLGLHGVAGDADDVAVPAAEGFGDFDPGAFGGVVEVGDVKAGGGGTGGEVADEGKAGGRGRPGHPTGCCARSEVRGQGENIGGQRSEIRGQRSEVRGQGSCLAFSGLAGGGPECGSSRQLAFARLAARRAWKSRLKDGGPGGARSELREFERQRAAAVREEGRRA